MARAPARRKFHRASAASVARLAPALTLDWLFASRIASLAVLVVCLASLVYFSYDTRFYVAEPTVAGNRYTDAGDVVRASEMERLHVAWIQPDRVEQLITHRLPTVRAAKVECALPASCRLAIEERHPLFVWRQGQAWAWVDAEGILFTAPGMTAETPVVDMPPGSLPLPGTRVDREMVSSVQALQALLPSLKALRYTVERGLEFTDPAGGWPVYLGSGPGLEARIAAWRALSDHLAQQGLRPSFVDVRFAAAPYYSLQ